MKFIHFFLLLFFLFSAALSLSFVFFSSLFSALFFLSSLWLVFTTTLHVMIRDDGQEDEDLTYAERYSDFLTAAQYTLLHMTGDYPLINYRTPERFVHFLV